MSSANKSNCINGKSPELPYRYYSIGNGYAWIMIDYDQLNSLNQNLINKWNSGEREISLDEKTTTILKQNCTVNQVPFSQSELFKFYRVVEKDGDRVLQNIPKKSKTPFQHDNFERKATTLLHTNSFSGYSLNFRGVALRFPMDETTTVEEVMDYFDGIAQQMYEQREKIKSIDVPKEEGDSR